MKLVMALRFVAGFFALRTQYDAFLVDWRRDDGDLNSLEARVATNRLADLRHTCTFAIACVCLRGITVTSRNTMSRHKFHSQCIIWERDHSKSHVLYSSLTLITGLTDY